MHPARPGVWPARIAAVAIAFFGARRIPQTLRRGGLIAVGKIPWRQAQQIGRRDRRSTPPLRECLLKRAIALFSLLDRQQRAAAVTVDDRNAEHGTLAQHSLVALDV